MLTFLEIQLHEPSNYWKYTAQLKTSQEHA